MIKVTDMAYARFAAPDLDLMEEFLVDFGLTRSVRTKNTLYMRGTNPDHHLHVTHLADKPGFIGMAFKAAYMEDLEKLSGAEGASAVEEMDEPGGGYRVRIVDPDGYRVETVFGIEELEPLPVSEEIGPDYGPGRPRDSELVRSQLVPCPVQRLGHVVLNVPSCNLTDAFYKSHFGFIGSDVCYVPGESQEMAVVFNRCDRGEEYVDHHTLLSVKSEVCGLAHIAFEVADVNALFIGNEYLKSRGYEHSWGVGRHTRGGQVFDYWFDPYGHRLEHFFGGDLLNADDATRVAPLRNVLASQWGAQIADRRASLETAYDPLNV